MATEFYRGLQAPEMHEGLPCPECKHRALAYKGYDFKTLYYVCGDCQVQFIKAREHVRRAVLYLDQWALSLMHKGAEGREGHEPWRHVLKRLSNLVGNQALLCPHSVYHVVDSQLDSRLAEDLDALFRHLAQGVGFKHHHAIEVIQHRRALGGFKEGRDFKSLEFPRRDAFEKDPDEPGEDLDIFVPFQMTQEDITDTRRKRDDGLARWADICTDSTPKELRNLEGTAREELRGFGLFLFTNYIDFIVRRSRMWGGQEAFDIDYLARTAHSQQVIFAEVVCESFTRDGVELEAALHRTREFFLSDHFAEMPTLKIGGLLIGAVRRKTASGRKPTATDAADINMIRHYAHYCDAMLIDNDFRAMATEAPVKIDQRYDCRLFSSRTRQDFLAWLDDCEARATSTLVPRESHGAIPDERIGAKLREKFGKVLGLGAKDGSEKAV